MLEIIYRIGFATVIFFKKQRQIVAPFPVISVGNISVGGTGKSPVVIFLANKISNRGAIVTRGYGRSWFGPKNLLVSKNDSVNLRDVGDEVMMFLSKTSLPVAVGSNRRCSVKLLVDKKFNAEYIILDDGYQNFQLKKDFEILLLDAREPLGNGHCLPAGPLREKDLSRADVILLTHADEISEKELSVLKLPVHDKPIFHGRHAVKDLVNASGETVVVSGLKFLAVAGIGSFSGFLNSLEKFGIQVADKIEFSDHFSYSRRDVSRLVELMKRSGCDAIVTTEKDWERFLPVVGRDKDLFFRLRISFEFLSKNEEDNFFRILYSSTGLTRE